MTEAGPQERRRSVPVDVGGVLVGGGAPVVVQSMTNTDTADVAATTRQVAELWRAGSELVRITVDRDEAAAAVPHIKDRLAKMNVDVPIVGDFHYIGHKLLADHPAFLRVLGMQKRRMTPHERCREPTRLTESSRHGDRLGRELAGTLWWLREDKLLGQPRKKSNT